MFDEDRQELRGEHSGETFRLGQRVTVKLAGVHVGRLEIDLEYKKEDEEGRRPFRRKRDESAPRRARFEDRDGGERRTGRRAFAGRKGLRPRRDEEELKRRMRYASDAWGDDGSEGGEKEFRGRSRFESRPRREERPFRDEERSREQGASPEREHGFRTSFRPGRKRFEQDAEAPFRREERSFRRREDRFSAEEGEERRFSRHEGEERSFRPSRPRFRHEERRPRFEEDERFRREDSFRDGAREEKHGRFSREEREEGVARRERPFLERGGERRFSRRDGEGRPFRTSRPRVEEGRKPSRFHDGEERSFRDHAPHRGRPSRARGEREDFHGAPDDFFAIHTEPERPVHRFGKRRK